LQHFTKSMWRLLFPSYLTAFLVIGSNNTTLKLYIDVTLLCETVCFKIHRIHVVHITCHELHVPRFRRHNLGWPKVRYLRREFLVEQDIDWLDVTMDAYIVPTMWVHIGESFRRADSISSSCSRSGHDDKSI
jgi:hypothetical protein